MSQWLIPFSVMKSRAKRDWCLGSLSCWNLCLSRKTSRMNSTSVSFKMFPTKKVLSRAPDKVRIFISKMSISSPNPKFDHLLESSHWDDSNKWSNIGFGKEIKQVESIEVNFTHLIWSSDVMWETLSQEHTPATTASGPDKQYRSRSISRWGKYTSPFH